jgi:hypothetical protein
MDDLKKDFTRLPDIAKGILSDGVLAAEFAALKNPKARKDDVPPPQAPLF